jgi:hypothetical protein
LLFDAYLIAMAQRLFDRKYSLLRSHRRAAANLLTHDKARCIAANIPKLAELLRRG